MKNIDQEKIINGAILPALVIAGPGTGKTHTLVEYVVQAIKRGDVRANRVLITTFTKKAAREVTRRILERLKEEGLDKDLANMMVGNFHSLALDFISKYKKLDEDFFTGKIITTEVEEFLVNENIEKFRAIDGYKTFIQYNEAKTILDIFAGIINSLIDPLSLKDSDDPREVFAYEVYRTYERILKDKGLMNFQLILKTFLDILEDEERGRLIRDKIDLVIIDEYQDTNLIQEQIAMKLTSNGNIMVFGDDDQGLYSFRGADVNNLLNFADRFEKFSGQKVTSYRLEINYRSNDEIVARAKDFIKAATKTKKDLRGLGEKNPNSIVRARAKEIDNLVKIVKILGEKINLGQIAFLFPSFNNPYPKDLEESFEKAGIGVINRKSDRFFNKAEIEILVYILTSLGGIYPIELDYSPSSYEERKYYEYKTYLKEAYDKYSSDRELLDFIKSIKEGDLISEVIYRALGLSFYQDLKDERAFSNIGKFMGLGVDYDELVDLDGDFFRKFISSYLYLYFKNKGLSEYDEDSYDKDAVNFMTIHQAKGLEFDVVFVSSLNDYPRSSFSFLDKDRKADKEEDLDFYRKYYTAFTRAKKLLVILDNSRDVRIRNFMRGLNSGSNIGTIDFLRKDREEEKKVLAFTSDIDLYMTCPMKYKLIRENNFRTVKTESLAFGSHIHELVEYINSEVYRKEDLYDFLVKNPDYSLSLSNYLGRDFGVRASEVNYKADRDFYILQGTIDLLLEDSSIMDLKTGSVNEDSLGSYKNQLLTYKNLLRLNKKEAKSLFLYFIEKDELIEVEDGGMDLDEIDSIARKIVDGEDFDRTKETSKCKFCPFIYYCKRS